MMNSKHSINRGHKLLPMVVAASLLLSPVIASADQIATLKAQIQALQQQLAALEQPGSSSATSQSQTTSAAVSCPAIAGTLDQGSAGTAVSQLQSFLASIGLFFHAVTGYYGPITTAAVRQFQAKNDIVSSGSPSTTGYGRVGPKTLAAIEAQCGGAGGPVGAFMQVSPTSGKTPLYVSVEATVNTTKSCAPATYTLDWGDQTQQIPIPVAANVCQPLQQTYTHTYTSPAAYVLTLSAGTHSSQATVVAQP